MAQNPNQPDREFNEEVAILAKVERLNRFSDGDLIDAYAERYGKDPDLEVFPFVRFDTLMFFAEMHKEKQDYRDRFQDVWKRLTQAIPEKVKRH